ncbi:MAG: hypothetical protein IPL61_12350 [Myxococcales bacterium]|nr:hypothetical protein [Myxococcales bacterium]
MSPVKLAIILLGIAACDGGSATIKDAAIDTPTTIDGAADIDAGVDASAALPAYELTGGAAGLRGARFSADVQIGHGFDQAPVGTTIRAEGNAAVKP